MENKWFDWNYIILVILGSWYFYKTANIKQYKRYITLILGAVLGIAYVYFYEYLIVADGTGVTKADIRVIINSYLLSTTIYELAGRDFLSFIDSKAPEMAKNLVLRESNRLKVQVQETAKEIKDTAIEEAKDKII
jgi:hypothetical protein